MITTEHIAIGAAPVFTTIPNPSAVDLIEGFSFTEIAGGPCFLCSSGASTVLTDGTIEPAADDPSHSYFSTANPFTFQVDLGLSRNIAMVNTYSRHEFGGSAGNGSRAAQSFTLYGSTDNSTFTPITTVLNSVGGGAWGNEITDTTGSLGSFRYLRFETHPDSDGTFYGEIDVFQQTAVPEPSAGILCALCSVSFLVRSRYLKR
jgi:hypothetical protein